MSEENVAAIRRLFAAVEQRDLAGVLAAYAPDVVIDEAESLPYGNLPRVGRWGAPRLRLRGNVGSPPGARSPLARCRGPRRWGNRRRPLAVAGQTPDGMRSIHLPAVSVYRMHDGRVAESRMFHQDTAAIQRFLADAGPPEVVREP